LSDGAGLHFELSGQGVPLVLLAGFASDLQTWVFQREALSPGHRLVLVDGRGAGRSPSPALPWTTREMAGDVLTLLERLGLSRIRLLGHSLGGAVAQELALLRPDLVERLVLVSTFSRGSDLNHRILEDWLSSVRHGLDEALLVDGVLPWLYSDAYLRHPNRIRAIVGFLRAHKYPPTAQGLQGQFSALREHHAADRLAEIACPTLVLVGALDRLTTPAMATELAAGIPGARLALLEGAAHVCMLEQADAFSRTVMEFLAAP
jgi:pimeloyl-ACP methyl ester carboxylesterase